MEFGSNIEEQFENNWKPGGTLVGVSGRWGSKVKSKGSNKIGRWSWFDLRENNNRITRFLSTYKISQDSIKDTGELKYCKQQARSMLDKEIKDHNLQKAFLSNLTTFIQKWRSNRNKNEIILIADIHEYISSNGALHDFCINNDLVDVAKMINSSLIMDKTYLHESKE